MFFSDLYPDSRFEILLDLMLINKGSVLEDMASSVHQTHEDSADPASGVQSPDPKTEQHRRCADLKRSCDSCTVSV